MCFKWKRIKKQLTLISPRCSREKDNIFQSNSKNGKIYSFLILGSTTGESPAPPAPAVPPKKPEKKETVILNTNLAGPDFGFTFNIDPNLADEFVNTWDEHTSTDYFTGFKVIRNHVSLSIFGSCLIWIFCFVFMSVFM